MEGMKEPMSTSGSDRLFGVWDWFLLVSGLGIAAVFSMIPLDNRGMVILDGVVLVLGFFLARRKTPGGRLVLVMLTLFVTVRYFTWRITKTIYGGPLDLFASALLLLAELYSATLTFLGYFEMLEPLPRPVQPLPADSSTWPTVDVLIPTYNEPLHVVRSTVISAQLMRYPPDRFQIYLLDDGRRKDMKELAKELGVVYLTRESNAGAKAGNLNAALGQTSGEIIVVFDCDHAPKKDFLEKTVGQFLIDPNLALVQTPHNLYSKDPLEKNLRLPEEIPNESELFYYVILPGKDLWNSAYFCGSAALLRRRALMDIGGFRTETVTEDAHTALTLHSKGYNSAYIAEPLVSGLAPETMADLVNQRIRWGRGMIQIFRFDNPLFLKGLTFPQRISYFTSIAYWLFPLARTIFLTAPLPFIFFNIYAVRASLGAIVLYLLPYLILSRGTNHLYQSRYRRTLWSEIYETALSMHLLAPVTITLFSPRRGKFSVTPKGSAITKESMDFPVAGPNLILLSLNLIGLCMIGYRFLYTPSERPLLILGLLWVSYNTLMLLLAVGASIESRQIRRFPRVRVGLPATVRFETASGLVVLRGTLGDLSIGGFSFRDHTGESGPSKGQQGCVLSFPQAGTVGIPFVPILVRTDETGVLVAGEFSKLPVESERLLVQTLFENAPLSWIRQRRRKMFFQAYLVLIFDHLRTQIRRILDHV